MLKRPKILVAGSFNMDLTASCTRAPGSGETVIPDSTGRQRF